MIELQLAFRKGIDNNYYGAVIQQYTDFYNYFNANFPTSKRVSIKKSDPGLLRNQVGYLTHNEHPVVENNTAPRLAPIQMSGDAVTRLLSLVIANAGGGVPYQVEVFDERRLVITFSRDFPPEGCLSAFAIQNMLVNLQASYNPGKDSKTAGPSFSCQGCMSSFPEEKFLTDVPVSTGKKLRLCKTCSANTTPCEECGFNEPNCKVTRAIRISDETGENERYYICTKCRSGHVKCPSCAHFFNRNREPMCPCRIKSDFKPHIQAHNADVLDFYPKDAYCNELFGVELEVGTPNKNRRLFTEIADTTTEMVVNDAILKYDSSIDWINKQEQIPNVFKGFEIVTRPMLYKNTVRFLKNFCKGRHPLLRSWEVGTCGLHIHVSKACLRPFEIGKVLCFVNNKANRGFIKMIAKREDKRFAKFIPKRILDYNNHTLGPNNIPVEHYEAVNTSKPYTIEFRIFRGTLNPHTVLSYVQFVKSLIDFVRIAKKDDLDYKKYVDFLFATEKSSFRELKRRLQSENMKEIREEGEV